MISTWTTSEGTSERQLQIFEVHDAEQALVHWGFGVYGSV